MTMKGKDTHGGYVPAERLFVPAVAMPGIVTIDDAFIEKVLRVGGMLREMGDVEGALACYEHFIGALRRFTMVPLGVAIADEGTARESGLANRVQAASESSES